MADFTMVRLDCIVFDFDGTLAELRLDFVEMKRRVAILAGEFLGHPPGLPGVPALEWIDELALELRARNPGHVEPFRAGALGLIMEMELESARDGRLFPFTRRVLEDLDRRRIKVGIITRNCEQALRLVFPDIDRFCVGFLARDHVPRVKPDPDHLLRILDRLAVDPGRALMVGDHPLDIQTGARAGVLAAGVWSGNATEAELARSGAHWTARNCEELMALLMGQGVI